MCLKLCCCCFLIKLTCEIDTVCEDICNYIVLKYIHLQSKYICTEILVNFECLGWVSDIVGKTEVYSNKKLPPFEVNK